MDFPVPVLIDPGSSEPDVAAAAAAIAAECGGSGGFNFYTPDGLTPLDFGVYAANLSTGYILARVKISPDADASVGDVAFRIDYSAAGTTTEDKAGTVSNGYSLFMPLEEDPSGSAPQMFDWVSETNIGTSAGSMTSGDLVAGQVGNGLDFDGNDLISLPDAAAYTMASGFTVRAICSKNSTSGNGSIVERFDTGQREWIFGWVGTTLYGFVWDATTGGSVARSCSNSDSGAFHDYVLRYDGGTTNAAVRLYRNGVQVDTTNQGSGTFTSVRNGTSTLKIVGNSTHLAGPLPCKCDEVSVSNVARSADWLEYSYTTDFNKTSLWTLSAEQGGGGGITGDFYVQGAPFDGYVTCAGVADQLPILGAAGHLGLYVDWDGTAGTFGIEGAPGYVEIS